MPIHNAKSERNGSGGSTPSGGGRFNEKHEDNEDDDHNNGKTKLSLEEKAMRQRQHEVAQYAVENLLNFVEFMQLFALLWAIMFRIPWPEDFVRYSSWTLFFNLDGAMYVRSFVRSCLRSPSRPTDQSTNHRPLFTCMRVL